MNEEFNKKDISIQKDTDRNANSSPINKANTDSANIIKKTEKIVTAVYLISGLLPENDPLKHSLRSQALNLLSFINSVFDPAVSGKIKYIAETASLKVDNLLSLLNIAFFTGYISEMNFNIIKGELEWFGGEIKNKSLNFVSTLVLTDDFLISKTPFLSQISSPNNSNNPNNTGSNLAISAASQSTSRKGQNKNQHKRHDAPSKAPAISKGQNTGRKFSRRESILSAIQKHGQPTIKDISSLVRDCSEKTIQRELVSLVEEGLIKRNGERRWSTYSAA